MENRKRELAYRLWQGRGSPEGTAEEDWLAAERELSRAEAGKTAAVSSASEHAVSSKEVDESLKDTFPASDPPGSHLPDVPPANADAKWEAAGKPPKDAKRRKNSTPNSAPTPKPNAPRPQGR